MAFNNVDSLNLGKLLQIVFSEGVRVQISEDYRDFEYVARFRKDNSAARELRFMLQSTLAPASVQTRNPGQSGRPFPKAHQPSISEKTALFKELNATIELDYSLWDRARKSPEKYAEPLALNIMSTSTSAKRRIAADLYNDGTGVIGQLPANSAAVMSPASSQLKFTLSSSNTARGFVGFFEYGDILKLKTSAGGTSALDTSLATEPVYWKVMDRDRENNTVSLMGLDSSFAEVAAISSISVQPAAGDVFYRYDQQVIPDLTSSIADYGSCSDALVGLESLAANDGRIVHGVTMSGSTASSSIDAGGNPLDVKHIQKVLDKVKVQVGQGAYGWKQMIMAPESHAALIESRETDRRFQSVDDNKRGITKFVYVHGNDQVEVVTSEYCPSKRIYMIPEAKSSGQKVLELHGSDFEPVKAQNMSEFHLKPASGGGYENTITSFLLSIQTLICKHPAAIARLHNFTNN